MYSESMTDQEWATHVKKSLRFESGVIMHVAGKRETWMWFDYDRPDVAELPALYRRTKDIASLITLGYVPT